MQLLTDPTTISRILLLHFAVVLLLAWAAPRLALPVALLVPSSPRRLCEAFLTCLHVLLGLVLATVLPVQLRMQSIKGGSGASSGGGSGGRSGSGGPGGGRVWGWLLPAEHCLQELCSWQPQPVRRLGQQHRQRRRSASSSRRRRSWGVLSKPPRSWREVCGVDRMGMPLAALAATWVLGMLLS